MVKTYEPIGTDVEILHIKNMSVQLKPGERAEELLDKITNLVKRFSEDGNWTFYFKVES